MNRKLTVLLIGLMIGSLVTMVPIKVNASTMDHVPLQEWMTGWNSVAAISADGNYTVVGDINGYIYLFQKDNDTWLWRYYTSSVSGRYINEVDISADGMYLVAGNCAGKMYFFNRTYDKPIWTFNVSKTGAVGVSISADGFDITGAGSTGLYLFNRTSNSSRWVDGPSVDGVISADGRYVCTELGTGIRFINASSGALFWSKYGLGSMAEPKISADGAYILATDILFSRKTTYLLTNAGNFIWNYTSPGQQWESDMSEDGEHILLAEYAGKVMLLNNSINTTIWSDSFTGTNLKIRLSADGNYFAVAHGGSLYLYDTATQALEWQALSNYAAYSLDISSNGDYIVVGSNLHTYLFHRVNEPSPGDGGPDIPGFGLMGALIAAIVASIWSINRKNHSNM
jgi:WD40 repeat protein